MKNKIRKSRSGKNRLSANKKQDEDISRQAVDLLVQIVRGELVKDNNDEIAAPTIAQRLAAAQMLLKMKEKPMDEKPAAISAVELNLPQRSQNFEEWLRRAQAMQSTESI
ncbi:MAG: hypothetical protein EYC62_02565 [Alphaproteobacteria bacterium]|nr:MAG: hypothetical protein EYC62_02565 [Alphaproteobacteria bacterium]